MQFNLNKCRLCVFVRQNYVSLVLNVINKLNHRHEVIGLFIDKENNFIELSLGYQQGKKRLVIRRSAKSYN